MTTHGDIHGANVVRSADGQLKAIDMESAGVGRATSDLLYMFGSMPMLKKDLSLKRSFIGAYLSGMSDVATQATWSL